MPGMGGSRAISEGNTCNLHGIFYVSRPIRLSNALVLIMQFHTVYCINCTRTTTAHVCLVQVCSALIIVPHIITAGRLYFSDFGKSGACFQYSWRQNLSYARRFRAHALCAQIIIFNLHREWLPRMIFHVIFLFAFASN